MAFQSVWYETELPAEIVNILEKTIVEEFNQNLNNSTVAGENGENTLNKGVRNAKHTWLPSSHWVTGFVMHYVNIANQQNFCYDLLGLDGQTVQYTVYDKGEFYNWHIDQGIGSCYKPQGTNRHGYSEETIKDQLLFEKELMRKLSFSLQLSDETEYKGGELQIIDDAEKLYSVPKKRGLLVCFDSRARHRVTKVTSGRRKSLVGWIVGPRWR
jgi:PKHD-type hydroxylase